MALGVRNMRTSRVVAKVILLTVGTIGFVLCLTLLYRSMRSVMDVGGFCASGGAYEIRTPCPTGVGWMVPVSIFGMLLSVGIGFLGVFSEGGPRPYVFAWSALFLALGWNFLDYGFNPPDGGTSASWLVCGFVFVAMGGVPLLFLFAKSAARWAFWGPPTKPEPDTYLTPYRPPPAADDALDTPVTPSPPMRAAGGLVTQPPSTTTAPSRESAVARTPEPAPARGDVVDRLERLANLRERGLLDDDDYETAKDRILHEEPGT